MIIHMQEKPGLPALSFSLLATTIPERYRHSYTRVGSFAFTCAMCIIQLVEIIIIILQPNGKTSNCGWERDRLASARLWGSLWPLGQRHHRQVCCLRHFWHLHHDHYWDMSFAGKPMSSASTMVMVISIISIVIRDRKSLRRRPPVPLAGFRTKTIRHAHNPFYRLVCLFVTIWHAHNPFYELTMICFWCSTGTVF